MKKTLVAAGVIVALGAVWTGAAWYTGKQLAQNIDTVTTDLNKRWQEAYPDSGIKLVYRDYQSGIFSSRFDLVLQADGAAPGARILTPGEEIVFNETVSHGPFPFAQLKKFHLAPSMAAVHTELANTPAVKPLFDFTQNRSFILAETRVAYSGDTSSVVSLLPVEYQENDRKLIFSGTDLQVDVAHDLRDTRLAGTLPNLVIEKKNQWGEHERVTIEALSIDANSRKGKFDIGLEDSTLTLKKLHIAVEGSEPVTFNGVTLKNSLTEDDQNLALTTDLTLDSLLLSERDLGAGRVNFAVSRLDGQGTKQFVTAYQQKVKQLLRPGSGQVNPLTFQRDLSLLFLQHLPQLLKGNPSITISPLSWKNAQGESSLTVTLNLTDPLQNSALSPAPQSDEEAIIRQSVKDLDVKLNVPMPMLSELMLQAGEQPATEAEKTQLAAVAQAQVKGLANIGEMNRMTATKDNAIVSSLHYADGQVDFNGNKMSLAEFIAPFIVVPAAPGEEPAPDAPAIRP